MSFDLHDIRGYTEYNNNNHNTVERGCPITINEHDIVVQYE